MRSYFRQIWRTKKGYIIALGSLLFALIIKLLYNGGRVNGAGIGLACGCLVAFALLYGPVMYLDAINSKIANPKGTFVEPPLRILVPLWLVASALIFLFFMVALSIGTLGPYIEAQVDADTFVGSFVMTFVLVSSLFGPGAIYTIYIRRHYKRIVEYDTAEWRRLRAKKKR